MNNRLISVSPKASEAIGSLSLQTAHFILPDLERDGIINRSTRVLLHFVILVIGVSQLTALLSS
jgi:hypothetical protein